MNTSYTPAGLTAGNRAALSLVEGTPIKEHLSAYGTAVQALKRELTPAACSRMAEVMEATLRLGIALGMSPHRRLGLLQATLEDIVNGGEVAA